MLDGKINSRSLRKTKILGISTGECDKTNKRRWSRTFRKVYRNLVRLGKEAPHKIHSFTEVWAGTQDGKRYYQNATKIDMRK